MAVTVTAGTIKYSDLQNPSVGSGCTRTQFYEDNTRTKSKAQAFTFKLMRYRLLFSWHLQGRLEEEMNVKKTALFERSEFVVFSERTTVRMVIDSYRS